MIILLNYWLANYCCQVLLPELREQDITAQLCYGIYISNRYLQEKGRIHYEKDVLEAFKLYERYWARAVVEYYAGELYERDGKERDFRGKRGALRAYNDESGSLNYHFLTRQLELGGLGAYRSSLEDLELIKKI